LLSNVPKTLFWNLKKSRPPTCPECYLSKAYVLSENTFDFGPLLIGKNAQRKNEKDIISTNSTTFKLVNTGHYPAEIEIALLSSTIENESSYKKGVFSVGFDSCTIQPNEAPKELRVWGIPDEAKAFMDEVIVMIKNNPTPIIVPIRCLGTKPVIEVREGSPIKFTRILLNQTIKREFKIQNTSANQIKFRLDGCEKLPQEFTVMLKEGRLKPNEELSIDVHFKAIKQQKFNESLKLIAEDVENMNIFSNPIVIPIEAEAFDITVDLKFPSDNTENLLDFGAIRVWDYKDQTFTIKNIGLYNVKISFTLKKKLYKECFKIEPMEF
jgi:hydrocephalus-inducing protein